VSLEARLSDDLKSAMREKNERRLSVIRMIRSGILLEKKKANAPETLPDEAVVRLVQAHVKKVKEALETAEKVGRADLAAEAREEIAIAEVYLPAALGDSELEQLVRAAVAETGAGATGPGAMGPVMKAVMAKAAGRADGKRVQEMVKKVLAGG
jgi:uncharacterized protein